MIQTSTLTAVASVLAGVVLFELGASLQGVLVPVRGAMEGFSTFAIGGFATAYYAGFVAGCLAVPKALRTFGHIRAFAAAAAVAAAASLILGMAVDIWAWLALRLLLGFCFAALYTVVESWLNFLADTQTRGRLLGAYMVVHWLATTGGKLLFAVDDPAGLGLFALVSIGICLSLVPVALTTGRSPDAAPDVAPTRFDLLGAAPVATVGCAVIGLANGAFWALGPLYAQDRDPTGLGVGLFMAVAVLGGAASQLPFGRWSDKVDRRVAIIAACLLAAAAALGLALAPVPAGAPMLALVALFGAGALPVYTLCIAHANDWTPSDSFVEVSARLLMLFGFGAAAGPLLAAGAFDLLGPGGLFAFTAAAHLLLAGFAALRMRQRAPLPPEEREAFSALPRTTAMAATLSPVVEGGSDDVAQHAAEEHGPDDEALPGEVPDPGAEPGPDDETPRTQP